MNLRRSIALAVLLWGAPVSAHRLDQYLQATMIAVERDHLEVTMRLIPGVAVSSTVIGSIDSNHDGVISASEQQNYAQQVLRDVSVSAEGHALTPRLLSATFPTIAEMKDGMGEVQIEFRADLPPGGARREIILQNHHQSRIAAYLVNCLVPRDPAIRVIAQHRNDNQAWYRLELAQDGDSAASTSWSGNVGFRSLFHLGLRHIAEGTDHLLFLLALLLPAPLVVVQHRWGGPARVRDSLMRILRIVTAFTVGHSLTLALAAFGAVRVPSGPVEVLIAVSILISAAHAIRPLFPGREAAISAFFGLVHGLAFAGTLAQLGLGGWQRVASLLGFNLGIETMQLIVVAAAMPSLLLLSRTRAYPVLRIGAGLLAGMAAAGWIAERSLNVHLPVDAVVNSIAHQAGWMALVLLLISLLCWSRERHSGGEPASV